MTLRQDLVRLAHEKPETRAGLVPLLRVATGYTKREITIPTATGTETLKADVKGNWAVYPAIKGNRGWTLAHAPSGKAVKADIRSKQLAMLILDAILEKAPGLLKVNESGIMAYRAEIISVLKRPPRGKRKPGGRTYTVEDFTEFFYKKLKAYDQRLTRQDRNHFRWGLYLEAFEKIEKDVAALKDRGDEEAMEALKRSMGRRFIVRESPPAVSVLKQIDKWLSTGKARLAGGPRTQGGGEGGFRLNAGRTPLAKARAYFEKILGRRGKTLDGELPDFDKGYGILQKRIKSFALGVPRSAMPVIEPEDMGKFQERLKSGRIDIFAPYLKGQKWAPKGLTPGSEAEKWLEAGVMDGAHTDDVVPAQLKKVAVKNLKPAQDQIWIEKMADSVSRFGPMQPGGPPTKWTIIVSKEGYILDGHHRFGEALISNPSIALSALVVPIDIKTLLEVGRTYGNAIGNTQNN